MWKIKHIFDGEYGCEELTEGQRPKVSVTLINEKEEETCFSVEDSWLTEHGLNEGDLWQNKHYEKCVDVYKQYLCDTNQSTAPWYLIDAKHKKWAELQVLEILVSGIDTALKNSNLAVPLLQNAFPLEPIPSLCDISLDKKISQEEYKEKLDLYQSRLRELHNELYRRKVRK